YRWKSFFADEDRPEKPRRYGVTEVGGSRYSLLSRNSLQDLLESIGDFVDGLKLTGGSNSSSMSKTYIKEVIDIAHNYGVYVSTGDWAKHLHRGGHYAFKQHIEECKELGFDAIEIDVGSQGLPEEILLRYVRLIKNAGLRANPRFSTKFNSADIPANSDRAFGAYVVPAVPPTSEIVEDVDLMIRRAERCIKLGADMIVICADDVCKQEGEHVRGDLIAKLVGRIGIERAMFEASDPKTSEWLIKQYGTRVNLAVDHSGVMDLECLRCGNLGEDHVSVLGPSYFI
ncbi:hypothetical protein M569_11276, partial [Genlisea aurea]